MPSLGELLARGMTPTSGVRAATEAYEQAVAAGASAAVLKKLFDELKQTTREYNEELTARTRQMHQLGSSLVGTASAGVTNQFTGFGVAAEGGRLLGNGLASGGGLMKAAGGLVTAFAAVAGAADQLSKAFMQRAGEIGKFSPDVTIAQAMRNVRLLMADIKEAQTLGPDMAKLIETETDIEIEIRDLILPIKKFLLENLVDFLKVILEFIKKMPEWKEEATTFLGKGLIGIKTGWGLWGDFYGEMSELNKIHRQVMENLKRLRELAEQKKNVDALNQMMDDAEKALLPGTDRGFVPPAAQELDIPAFQGL